MFYNMMMQQKLFQTTGIFSNDLYIGMNVAHL